MRQELRGDDCGAGICYHTDDFVVVVGGGDDVTIVGAGGGVPRYTHSTSSVHLLPDGGDFVLVHFCYHYVTFTYRVVGDDVFLQMVT